MQRHSLSAAAIQRTGRSFVTAVSLAVFLILLSTAPVAAGEKDSDRHMPMQAARTEQLIQTITEDGVVFAPGTVFRARRVQQAATPVGRQAPRPQTGNHKHERDNDDRD